MTSQSYLVATPYICFALRRWKVISSKFLNVLTRTYYSRTWLLPSLQSQYHCLNIPIERFLSSLCDSGNLLGCWWFNHAGILVLFVQNHIVTCLVSGKSLIRRYVWYIWFLFCGRFLVTYLDLFSFYWSKLQVASTPMPQMYQNKMVSMELCLFMPACAIEYYEIESNSKKHKLIAIWIRYGFSATIVERQLRLVSTLWLTNAWNATRTTQGRQEEARLLAHHEFQRRIICFILSWLSLQKTWCSKLFLAWITKWYHWCGILDSFLVVLPRFVSLFLSLEALVKDPELILVP